MRFCMSLHGIADRLETGEVGKRQVRQHDAAAEEVDVALDETRQDCVAAGVDHQCVPRTQRRNVLARAHGKDAALRNRQCLGAPSGAVHRQDPRILDDHVCRHVGLP